VSQVGRPGLDRSGQELAAARLLSDHGFTAPAVSRAYFAAFYAAEFALMRLGEVRSKHAGVIAAVGRVLVVEHGLDPEVGRLLRSLFERRSRADYDAEAVPAEEAARAVADATRVVDAITTWLINLPQREPTAPD
jgi:uncharacterized protein (UPF0332 family)